MKVLIKEVIDQGVLLGRAVGGRGAMGSTDKSRFFFFSLNVCLCPLHSGFRTEYFSILDC